MENIDSTIVGSKSTAIDTTNHSIIKKIAVVLYYVMFIYSGFNKILHFKNKVKILGNKTHLPEVINSLGMIGVIILEIIGSLIIIIHKMNIITIYKTVVSVIYTLFLVFLVVVTILYHPPTHKKIIPFLSNVTHFAGLLYMFSDI